jgi:hypothetical protein
MIIGVFIWYSGFVQVTTLPEYPEVYNGHVWMEVLVLVCNKLTPKLTLWSQTHVLVWC